MAKYKIVSYSDISRTHSLIGVDNTDVFWRVDLSVDGTFPELYNLYDDEDIFKDIHDVEKSLIGKTIEVEELFPIMYAAKNIKFV